MVHMYACMYSSCYVRMCVLSFKDNYVRTYIPFLLYITHVRNNYVLHNASVMYTYPFVHKHMLYVLYYSTFFKLS